VSVGSKVWVFGRSFTGIAGSNPAGGMDICFLQVLCVVLRVVCCVLCVACCVLCAVCCVLRVVR
jgi:hypothetical protein